MPTSYIFLDVDGTLVNYHNELQPSALDAIHQARANGHKIYLVTGRSKAENAPEITALPMDGYIGGNGNYIENDGNIVSHETLSLETCQQIVDWLHERKLEFYIESNAGLFASKNFETRGLPVVKAYGAFKNIPGAEDITVRSTFPQLQFDKPLVRDDVNKISFILDDYQDYLDAKEMFADFQVGTWGGVGEQALFGDVALKDINKATGIEKLLRHLGVENKNTFAFGDAKVDIPMLSYCETGIAMGNGGPEIKAIADFITKDVDEDGIYHAFKHFNMID